MTNETNTLSRFLEIADEARHWEGHPWLQECPGAGTKENNGYIVNMKKSGWIKTYNYENGNDPNDLVIVFLAAGLKVAADNGIDLSGFYA